MRGTYVHRGDVERRKRRIRAALLAVSLVAAGTLAARSWEPAPANAAPATLEARKQAEVRRLRAEVEAARGELALASAQLKRWHQIFSYARRFHIDAGLAGAIYDAALAEGLDPELAFPLVRLESDFKERATSPVGAIGLTQLMLPTARGYAKDITREELYNRETNLRIGFRYLRDLIREQRGNVQLALLIYNRGYLAVNVSRELGLDPSNGYDQVVLKGYRGKGTID